MKHVRTLVFITSLALGFGAVLVFRQQRLRAEDERTAGLRLRQQVNLARGSVASLEQQSAELRREIDLLRQRPVANPQGRDAGGSEDDGVKQRIASAVAEARWRRKVPVLMHAERFLRPKFEQLGLTPEHWESYKALRLDLLEARELGEARGLTAAELKRAVASAQSEFEQRARDVLGPGRYDELRDYQTRLARASQPGATAAEDLMHALLFTDQPLSSDQARRVEELVTANLGEASRPALALAAAEQAQTFLSSAQMVAWRRNQAAYRLQEQLNTTAKRAPSR